jgi:hypothetical protein
MPPVDFDPRAVREARAARRWYARVSAALATAFLAAPQAWPPHVHGTRAFRLRRFPYHLVYVEQPTGVLVIAVAHNRRRPGYWRRRLP